MTAGLIGVGVLGFFSYVSGLGWGWVTILGTPGAVRSWTAPTTSLALLFTGMAHVAHIGVSLSGVLTGTRVLGLLAAGVVGVWLLLNSDRIGTLKALGVTLLVFVILGPVVQPWYLSWGLILLAPVALGRLRSLIIGLSMVTAFIELPGGTQLVNSLIHGDPLLIVLTLLWILVVLTVPLASWERSGAVRRWRSRPRDGPGPGLGRLILPDIPGPGWIGPPRTRSEQALEDRDVQPAVELAAHLLLDADHGEAAGQVQGDRGLVAAADAGDHGVEPVLAGQDDAVPPAGPDPRPRPGWRAST